MTQDPTDTVFDSLAGALAPVELDAARRERLRSRIARQAGDHGAPPPEGTRTIRTDEGWLDAGPMLRIKVLRRDPQGREQTTLLRFMPGAEVPAHTHTQVEEITVLEGSCEIDGHVLRVGDTHIASPGSVHRCLRSPTGCVLLLRSEYPLPGSRTP